MQFHAKSFRLVAKTALISACLALYGLDAAHAAPESRQIPADTKSYAGALLGVTSVSEGPAGTGLGFGLNFGYFFSEKWGAGLAMESGTHGNDYTSLFFLGEAIYSLESEIPGLFLSGILGTGRFRGPDRTGEIETGETSLTFGAKVAYEYPISPDNRWTVGAQLSVKWLKPATTTLTIVNPMLTAKWWF